MCIRDSYYRVIAENMIGSDTTNGWSTTVSYQTPTAPDSPTNLDAIPAGLTNSAAVITWDAPSNTGSHPISGYKIERNVNSGGWQLAVETNTSTTQVTDTQLNAGSVYEYRVFTKTVAGYSASASNTASVEMLAVNTVAQGAIVGGNTVTVTPVITITDGDPNATIDYIQLFQNAQLVSTDQVDQALATGNTYTGSAMYAYPTTESQFKVIAKLLHGNGASFWESSTITLTPDDPFTGDLSLLEVRTDVNGDPEPICTTDCFVQSDLTLNIQPSGSDVIIKYQPEDNNIAPTFLGYENVVQDQQVQVPVDPNMNYYISIYIAPGFTNSIDQNNQVTITCADSNNDGVPDLPTCRDGDIPTGYGSTMAVVSEKSPDAPKSLGIAEATGIGDLFGLPMVFIFVIGFASLFTSRTGHMGLIFVGALIGIMYAMGFIDFGSDSQNAITWGMIVLAIALGTILGKKW